MTFFVYLKKGFDPSNFNKSAIKGEKGERGYPSSRGVPTNEGGKGDKGERGAIGPKGAQGLPGLVVTKEDPRDNIPEKCRNLLIDRIPVISD